MKLSGQAVIARAKMTQYLLVDRPENDKSKFLAGLGYTMEQADRLVEDVRKQLLPLDAELIEKTEYGEMFRICGLLTGANGRSLKVASIWMQEHPAGLVKFITLYPAKD